MKKYQALQILKESGFKVIREAEEDFESYLQYVDSAFERSGGIDDYHDSGVDLDELARACYKYGMSSSEAIEKLKTAAKNGLKNLSYRISDVFGEDLYDIMDWNNLELCKKLVDVMQTANARTSKGIKEIYNVISGGTADLKSKKEREKEENVEFVNWLKGLMAKYGISIEDLWEFGLRDLNPEAGTLATAKYSDFPFGSMYYREKDIEKLKSKRKIYVTRLIRKIDELKTRGKLVSKMVSYLNRKDPKKRRWHLVSPETSKGNVLFYVLGIDKSVSNVGGEVHRKTEYSGNTENLSDYEFMKDYLDSIVPESTDEREQLEKVKAWVKEYFNK